MGYNRKMFIIHLLLAVFFGTFLLKVPVRGDPSSLSSLLISAVAVLSVIYAIFFPLYLDYLRKKEIIDFPLGENYFYFVFLSFSSILFLFLVILYSLPTITSPSSPDRADDLAIVVISLTGICFILVAPFITTNISHMFADRIMYKGKLFDIGVLLDNIDEKTIGLLRKIGDDGDWNSASRDYVTQILNKMFTENLALSFKSTDFFEGFFGSPKRGIFRERTEGIISIFFKKFPSSNLRASDLYPYMGRKITKEYTTLLNKIPGHDSTGFTDTINEITEFVMKTYKEEDIQYKSEMQSLLIFLFTTYLGLRKSKKDREKICVLIYRLLSKEEEIFMKAYETLITKVTYEEQEDLRLLLEKAKEADS